MASAFTIDDDDGAAPLPPPLPPSPAPAPAAAAALHASDAAGRPLAAAIAALDENAALIVAAEQQLQGLLEKQRSLLLVNFKTACVPPAACASGRATLQLCKLFVTTATHP